MSEHEHHHAEIRVAHPEPNTGNFIECNGQPLPELPGDPYPSTVVTVLENHVVKIVITDSIKVFTYYIRPMGHGLKLTTLLPHGIRARRGENDEIFIEPTHVN